MEKKEEIPEEIYVMEGPDDRPVFGIVEGKRILEGYERWYEIRTAIDVDVRRELSPKEREDPDAIRVAVEEVRREALRQLREIVGMEVV